MKIYVKSSKVNAKTALSKYDPIRKLLGEKEWFYIEDYLINGDQKYSLQDILFDETAWDDYADWKFDKYHEKAALSASTKVQARKIMASINRK